MAVNIRLRDVEDGDLDALYEYQHEPESSAMAAVPSREREAFMAHAAKIRADERTIYKTIVLDGQVVGDLVCFGESPAREVGYRIGRTYWGQGIATRALALFLAEMPERPLHATVAQHNPASRRVLEKCGFVLTGEAVEDDGVAVFYFTLGRPSEPAKALSVLQEPRHQFGRQHRRTTAHPDVQTDDHGTSQLGFSEHLQAMAHER